MRIGLQCTLSQLVPLPEFGPLEHGFRIVHNVCFLHFSPTCCSYKELVTGEQQALIAALARQARDGILINPATGQASTQTPPIIR